jgi:hypothetical protein
MLLTNQKNYKLLKFIQKYKETIPRFFDGTNVVYTIAELQVIYQL